MAIVALTVAALMPLCAGALSLRLARADPLPDPIARLGLAMAAGLSVIPLLLEWLPNVHWTPAAVRLLFAGLMLGWIGTVPWRRFLRSMRRLPVQWYLVAAAFFLMIVGLAIAQVDAIPVAPGVDSVHHLMLTRLIIAKGGLPDDLDPFISGGRLAYHWGAHANVAFVALLLGRSDPFAVSELMVWYAAFLRIVCSLTLYAAARSLFADRFTALMSGAIAAGFSALPAALVTQGRFTQLAGVAVLPALIALRPGNRRPVGRSIVTAILLAGVFLIQARLVVFGIAWVVVAPLFSARRPAAALVRAAFPLCLAGALILPWGLRLAREPLVRSMLNGDAFAQSDNRWTQRYVPAELVWLRNNGLLLSGATAGLTGIAGVGVSTSGRVISGIWWCVVLFAASRAARRWKETGRRSSPRKVARRKAEWQAPVRLMPWRPLALVLCWVVLSAAFLFARSPAVDMTTVVPYAVGALTSFIPMILMTIVIVSWVVRMLLPAYRAAIAIVALAACALTGIAQHPRYAVHSPVPDADRRAMEWIVLNIPRTARFAVMARPFYGIFVGEDAGYWIQVLTDRRSLLPPMIYGWVSPISEVERTNALLRLWTTVHPESSVPKLVAAGVTHAYIGSTAHPQARNIMRSGSRFKMIYDRDGVLIAEIKTDR